MNKIKQITKLQVKVKVRRVYNNSNKIQYLHSLLRTGCSSK